MLSKKMQKMLNDQINMELYSAYIYWSISAYFHSMNLDGFARWMRLQGQEEMTHAAKIFDHVLERDGTVTLAQVKGPPTSWKSPLAACQAALKHEQMNSKRFNTLMDAALSEKDHASSTFLQWFVDEQVEEEAQTSALVENVRMVKDSGGALFMLDRELGARQLGPEEGA
ncbi:MAG: ferritin [Candidatus Latescibacterota bacterium]|nr:MAG: ferritin [Candidatus Latescibacterota bacterium]